MRRRFVRIKKRGNIMSFELVVPIEDEASPKTLAEHRQNLLRAERECEEKLARIRTMISNCDLIESWDRESAAGGC